MSGNSIHERGEIIYRKQEVIGKIAELAVNTAYELRQFYPVVVPMLRGAGEFMDELNRQWRSLDEPFTPPIAPVWVSRYDNGIAKIPKIVKHIQMDVAGRTAVVVDEIIEGGESMDLVESYMSDQGAKPIKRIVLMKRLSAGGQVDYHALDLYGDEWVNGWGADRGDGTGREPEDIVVSIRQPGDV